MLAIAIFYCVGKMMNKKHLQYRHIFVSNIFNPQLVGSMDVDATEMKDQLHIDSFILQNNYELALL